jgi:hypothetical protein
MSLSRISSSEPLADSEVRSLAPAVSRRLATSLAGRGRYLLELLRGDTAGFADDGATPLNPQGQRGIDRSGPPWGDAHQHPIWVTEYANGTDVLGEVPTATLTTVGQIVGITARFFVRPFYVSPLAPYSRAYFRGLGTRLGSAGTTAGATVRVYGPDGLAGSFTSATLSTTTTAQFGTGAYAAELRPGWNERLIQFELTSLSVGATGMDIGPCSLNQVVRRTH